MPVVSVVTPVYNGEPYLRSCIESVLAQSYSDWEYVIVDNCSSDGSRSIAESYTKDRRIRVHYNERTLPVTASFNRTAALASPEAKYLKFVCADDYLFPNCLELMVGLAEANPTVSVVGSYRIHGKDLDHEGPPYPETIVSGRDVCRWFFEGRIGILGSDTDHMIRLDAVRRREDLFDDTFPKHSDTELFIRLLKNGADFGFVHQVLTFTREHDASVSTTESRRLGTAQLEWLGILLKHGRDFLSQEDYESLLRVHRKKYYRFLFRVLLKVWDRRVLNYHTASWKKLGIQLQLSEFVCCALLEGAASALHPVDTLRRVKREHSRITSIPRS
jgi:glycosyltransferase involved in cell wall biosynthesis